MDFENLLHGQAIARTLYFIKGVVSLWRKRIWSRMGIYDAEKNCVGAVGYNIAESIAYTE